MTTQLIPHRSTAWVAVIDSEGFTLGLATYGEAGYAPMKADQRVNVATWEQAQAVAKLWNELRGRTPEEAMLIQADTMRRQNISGGR